MKHVKATIKYVTIYQFTSKTCQSTFCFCIKITISNFRFSFRCFRWKALIFCIPNVSIHTHLMWNIVVKFLLRIFVGNCSNIQCAIFPDILKNKYQLRYWKCKSTYFVMKLLLTYLYVSKCRNTYLFAFKFLILFKL